MYDYWHMRDEKKKWGPSVAVVLLIIIALFSGIIIGAVYSPNTRVVHDEVPAGQEHVVYMKPVMYGELSGDSPSSFASVSIPAVDDDGIGIITNMFVQVFPGNGRILTNIDKLLFWVDTQNSIRRATQVAENVTGINISSYDIIYTIEANASVIGGPSAGAAITIATIASLQNKTVNGSVVITGSVNHDGSIGPVGNIIEKAEASKKVGATTFLVPLTQSTEVTYKNREYCEKIGWVDFCTTETYPVKVDVADETGLNVIEVMDIEDAMKYMLY